MNTLNLDKNHSMDRYVAEINRYSLLSREEERRLARQYQTKRDLQAAHALVVANLRFVVKIAHEYRGYGLSLLDTVQEGNIGLMMAVKKFDPNRGYRLISYAVWWVRAYIQNFIIRSYSLVKMGTTQAQRKLFFRLRSERERADRDAGPGEVASASELAGRLKVAEGEVTDMEVRLAGKDYSLDAGLDQGAGNSHLDLLPDPTASQEESFARHEERVLVRETVDSALEYLNPKERYIVRNRLLAEEPKTLQEIGAHFRISRERARQIEGNVIRKIRGVLTDSGLQPLAA